MKKEVFQKKENQRKEQAEKIAKQIGNALWENSPETLIHSPIIDFDIIPRDFNLLQLTSNKVHKLIVEVGTGNGDFLTYLSKRYKTSFIIGFEIAKEYFIKTKNNLMRELCLNAKVSHEDVFVAIRDKFEDESISRIYINFPDPWPKKRHWKRRFLTTEKLPIILQKMKKGGIITFVTDHMGYAGFVTEICKEFCDTISYEIKVGIPEEYPETKYFRKWKKLGKKDYKTIVITKK